MKKFMTIVATCAMLSVFAGCGNKSEKAQPKKAKTEKMNKKTSKKSTKKAPQKKSSKKASSY